MTSQQGLVSMLVFGAAALAISWSSIDYYWNWDDLHLLRPLSRTEIARAFTSHWGLSRFETQGLRPFTVLFNYGRWLVFGEHVVTHRLFLIGLMAGYYTLLSWMLLRLGGSWTAALIAGLVAISAKNGYYHIVWIADGIHLFQALLVMGAAHWLLTGLDRRRVGWCVGSACLMAVALLTREDSLAFYPILPLLGLFYAYRREQVRAWVPALARYTMALVCIWFTVWLWRLAAVPNAPQFKFGSDAMARLGNMARWTIDLSGQQDAAGLLFSGLLGLALVATTILARRDRELALLFLALTAVAVLPGNVRAVPNLLLFAISFYAIFLSVVLTALARRHVAARVVVAGILAAVVVSSARASRLEQVSLHPMSTGQMSRDWTFIYGDHRTAVVPQIRVEHLREKLNRYGITSASFDFDRWNAELTAKGHVMPDDDNPFVPPRRFLRP